MHMKEILMNRRIWLFVLAGCAGGAISLAGNALFSGSGSAKTLSDKQSSASVNARYASIGAEPAFDFTAVAEVANPAVVHIISTVNSQPQQRRNPQMPIDPFEFFKGPGFQFEQPGPRSGSGSGVILTDDGYIVTNNHVIDNASKIEVILNDKRSYIAELVGTDPNTDIAVLRIAENNLPFIKLGNSDQLKVGQWVVAVGNPFNLTSTVTVGIVSALGRNIDLIRSNGNQYAIENFIQTDAAINPGNSGGALLNTQGELVGINTAIASETGSYSGYAFAVPVILVEKVFNDITQYGKVQRAILGVSIQDISQNLADEKNLTDLSGVYVAEVVDKGAADKAGIQPGDVLLKINNTAVNSSSKLQETIGKFRPGDKVQVTLRRKGKEMVIPVSLLSTDGKSKPELAERESSSEAFGMELINTTREERLAKSIKTGVKVKSLGKGVFKDAGIPTNFIIRHINNQPVYSAAGAVSQLKSMQGAIVIEGLSQSGEEMVFGVKLPITTEQ